MSLKCAGVYSMPTAEILTTSPENTVEDGKLKSINTLKKYGMEKMGAHVLQDGEKVYIIKIDGKTDLRGDVLRFDILTTQPLDVAGSNTKKNFSATVLFRFKKGYLEETPPEDVEQVVEAVLAPDTGGDQSQASAAAPAQQPVPPTRPMAPPPPPAPVAPAGPPPTISIGESSTQVLQALGMPLQMIDLGKKKTYIYKTMKVFFVDDKVSDVQ